MPEIKKERIEESDRNPGGRPEGISRKNRKVVLILLSLHKIKKYEQAKPK